MYLGISFMFLALMPITYCNIFITIILRFMSGFLKLFFYYYYFVMFSFCYCFVLFISTFFFGGGYLFDFFLLFIFFFFFWLLFAFCVFWFWFCFLFFFLSFSVFVVVFFIFLLLYLLFINNFFVRCYIFFSFCFLFLFSTIQRRRWKCRSRFLQNNQTSHMMIYIFFLWFEFLNRIYHIWIQHFRLSSGPQVTGTDNKDIAVGDIQLPSAAWRRPWFFHIYAYYVFISMHCFNFSAVLLFQNEWVSKWMLLLWIFLMYMSVLSVLYITLLILNLSKRTILLFKFKWYQTLKKTCMIV